MNEKTLFDLCTKAETDRREANGRVSVMAFRKQSDGALQKKAYMERLLRDACEYAALRGEGGTEPLGLIHQVEVTPVRELNEDAILQLCMSVPAENRRKGVFLMNASAMYSSHLPIMLAYHCGLRKGEVFGLTWDMVDLEEGLLYVRRQMQRCTVVGGWQLVQPKYNSVRRVRLDPVIWDLLKRTREQQLKRREHYGELYTVTHIDEEGRLGNDGEEIELVLIRDDGSFIIPEITHNISYVVRKELGYELFDFHSLRHTHATELCENGVNLKEIQRRLGHKSFEVTNRIYLHATDAMERESIEIMKKMHGGEK